MKALICLALLVAGCARPDSFDWSYNRTCSLCGPFVDAQGNPVNNGGTPATLFVQASGTFTTTDTPVNGALTILAVTGTRTTNWFMGTYLHPAETDTIGTLLPVDPSNPHGLVIPPDNLLYPNGPNYLDLYGVAFTMRCDFCGTYYPSGSIVQMVSGTSAASALELGTSGLGGTGSFTLTPVPEPATFVLLLLAAIPLAILSLQRRRPA